MTLKKCFNVEKIILFTFLFRPTKCIYVDGVIPLVLAPFIYPTRHML